MPRRPVGLHFARRGFPHEILIAAGAFGAPAVVRGGYNEAMARRTPHLCAEPGCGEVLLDGPGRCERHKRSFNWGGPRLAGYDSSRWRRVSQKVRRERPICEGCGKRRSEEVHHTRHLKFPHPQWYDERQLMALCAPCHRQVTSRHAALRRQGRA
jgi:5-methylcytosine-specific restriction endonuclease McrA